MKNRKVSSGLVASILLAARNTYPDEFLAMLGEKEETGIVEELVIVPALFGRNFSSLRMELVPFDRKIVGSVHSHPSESREPSSGDLQAFSKLGDYHLIAAYPYTVEMIAAYNGNGKRLGLEIVEKDPNFI